MKMLPFFSALIAFMLLSASVSLAAEGIDSAVGSDLPLNAQGVQVATIRATPNVPGSGMLDVNGLVYAGKGAKIGPVGNNGDINCVGQEGIMRYNIASHEMQYCNGSVWKAAFDSSKTCPAIRRTAGCTLLQNPDCTGYHNFCVWLGGGTDEQLVLIVEGSNTCVFQCINGAWATAGYIPD